MPGSVLLLLVRVLGRRPFLAFGFVSLLTVALLAAVNLTSHRALERYVADQVSRVPWDISVYQTAEVPVAMEVRELIAKQKGVTRVEELFFLRTVLPQAITPRIDNEPLRTPWLSMLSASSIDLLPPDMRPSERGAILVLVGSRAQMGDAYLQLQNRKSFQLRAMVGPGGEVASHSHDGAESEPNPEQHVEVFSVPLDRTVRVDRNELNRWFLDKTSSPTLVPELGAILVVPYDREIMNKFDALSRGIVSHEDAESPDYHVNTGDYFPEIVHLAALDRQNLISGWDVAESLDRLQAITAELKATVKATSYSAAVDNTAAVLLERMAGIAHQIDLIGLLVSLPLLWMAWILMVNLSGLLLLNERRKLGLLRLRGTSATSIRTALLLTIAVAAFFGGLVGAVLGTWLPAMGYTEGALPLRLLVRVQQPEILLVFLAVGTGMALLVSRRFILYAAAISPLEASGRVVASEANAARVRFGLMEAAALLVGGIKIAGWLGGFSVVRLIEQPWAVPLDRALDFVSFPLFVYGCGTLIAANRRVLTAVLSPIVHGVSGRLAPYALRHLGTRQHRMASFLLIVAMMASLSLYPGVMTAVFDDKIERGAETQLGAAVQFSLDAPALVPGLRLIEGGLTERYAATRSEADIVLAKLRTRPEVAGLDYIVEGLVDGLYMPGYGFSGVPIFFINNPDNYMRVARHEGQLGATDSFTNLIAKAKDNEIVVSQAIQGFYKREMGSRMPVGRNIDKSMQTVRLGGALHYLPGMPTKTVNDRQSFVAARVDYLNHLFGFNAYMVSTANNPWLAKMDVLIPRVVVIVRPAPGVSTAQLREVVRASLPSEPLEIRDTDEEVSRLGSDMYIYLARQNFQIYLIGGLLLAIIGIFAIALSNYAEDRRTLALLRIRGCGPRDLLRFSAPGLFAPSVIGLLLGAAVAAVVGFGITHLVWELRQILTVLSLLPSHLALSHQTLEVAGLLVALLVLLAFVFSRWIFRRSAREGLRES